MKAWIALFLGVWLTAICPAALAADAVNINTATVEQLDQRLNGVGPSKAQAIVSYRKAHGSFDSVEALAEVKGIGQRTVEKNRSEITVGR
ncbi:MAG: ComEA family DNA-binding protein [Pseudomonadota bacterium]